MGRNPLVWTLVVLGIVFAVIFYGHATLRRHEARTERVFELAKEYRQTLRVTNVQFSNRWNEYLNDSIDPYNGGNITEEAYAELVTRFLSADSNADNYNALAGFYDSVGQCVQVGLCDFWYARSTFGSDIVTFYHNMYPALQSETQQGHGYPGIYDFVGRMRDADRGVSQPGWTNRVAAWDGELP